MPPIFDALLPHAPAFLVVASRIAGLFIFAPVLAGAMIPGKFKAMLVIALAAAVYPTINLHQNVPLRFDLLTIAPAMICESLIGLSIGLIAALPMYAIQMSGLITGQQMGMGLASVYNPSIDAETDVVGQLLLFTAMGVFLAAGGLDAMVRAVGDSFAAVPIGGFALSQAPLSLVTGLVSSGFELAVRVSAPALCILAVETAATGLITKSAPQINIMSFGFPVRITLGLGAVYASLGAAHEAMTSDVRGALGQAMEWAGALGSAGGL